MSVKQQVTKSVLWSAIERFSVQGIQFLLSIVIARQLLPSDYGLVAMLSIFMAIAQTFIDGGFANALIQKKDRSETDYSTVFYFNILIALVLYILLYLASPFIAVFYEEMQLEEIAKVAGLVLIVNSFGIVQQAKLTVALDFKRMAFASLIAVLVSGLVGVWMAYSGYGVWTLVYQSLFNNVMRVILIWVYSQWKPRLSFSGQSFYVLFLFGSKLLLSSLLHTIYTNLYTLIIGKKFASVELGYYNRAFTLAQFPSTNLTNVIVRAVYPIQCRIQDDDEQLCNMFLKYMRIACYLIFPIMIGFCAVAEPLVRIILTDKWLPVVPLLQILCIAYMWDPVMKINHTILNVKGRSDYFLYAEILKKGIAFIILFATLPFGVMVMCAGLIVYAFADIMIITYFTYKLTNISLKTQLKELLPVLFLSFSMGGLVYGSICLFGNAWIQLSVGIIVGISYYLFISVLFHFKEMKILRSFGRC
ncbi:lipopolysaccharide biosynthesis protein [Parabacteroides timonensis]|uniref:lipopolysaccharide biosynthesis protein n=1 Tax=Parabacteroides timonensis TaxID=1871013 RepID=UPI00094F28CA|nr:lipopolysaccharide biosynthesis protein [Parabacteroides timonensis]